MLHPGRLRGACDLEAKAVAHDHDPRTGMASDRQSERIAQAKKKGAHVRTPNPNRETKIWFDHRHAVPTDQHVAILPMPPARMLT
jgi:hypothetical protein